MKRSLATSPSPKSDQTGPLPAETPIGGYVAPRPEEGDRPERMSGTPGRRSEIEREFKVRSRSPRACASRRLPRRQWGPSSRTWVAPPRSQGSWREAAVGNCLEFLASPVRSSPRSKHISRQAMGGWTRCEDKSQDGSEVAMPRRLVSLGSNEETHSLPAVDRIIEGCGDARDWDCRNLLQQDRPLPKVSALLRLQFHRPAASGRAVASCRRHALASPWRSDRSVL